MSGVCRECGEFSFSLRIFNSDFGRMPRAENAVSGVCRECGEFSFSLHMFSSDFGACKTFSQPSAMSSSDSESTCSDLTSVAGSPIIQDLEIIMATDSTVGSGDDGTDSDGKTAQMIATNSSSASASTAQTSASTAQIMGCTCLQFEICFLCRM